MVKGGATVLSPSLRVLGENVRYTEKGERRLLVEVPGNASQRVNS